MGLFDVSAAVQLVAVTPATVSRYVTDTYDLNGRANPRTVASTLTISLSVQPTTGSERRLAPEGIDVSTLVSIWTVTQLEARDRVVVASGVHAGTYEVVHLEPWDVGTYCKALARKLAAGEPGEA